MLIGEGSATFGDLTVDLGGGAGLRLVDDDVYCLNRLTCNLLEFLATSVSAEQPVLLVGETGVGKTATVQYLSK